MISKEKISTEEEAKALLIFIVAMCDQSAVDMKENKTVLGHSANTYDAEKTSMVIEDFIEDSGFDYLLE